MDAAIVSTLAALGGSTVGALAPVFSNLILQRSSTHREFLTKSVVLREQLYGDFIKESFELYVDALTKSLEGFAKLISLYALISRMRLVASDPVVAAAEDFFYVRFCSISTSQT